MKKILTFAIALTLSASSVFASGGEKLNNKLTSAVQKSFAGATNIHWQELNSGAIHQATFTYMQERIHAFYAADGQLIATGRYLKSSNLPLLITGKINRKFQGYEITEVIEYIRDEETSYLIGLRNDETKVVIQSYNSGNFNIIKKEKI